MSYKGDSNDDTRGIQLLVGGLGGAWAGAVYASDPGIVSAVGASLLIVLPTTALSTGLQVMNWNSNKDDASKETVKGFLLRHFGTMAVGALMGAGNQNANAAPFPVEQPANIVIEQEHSAVKSGIYITENSDGSVYAKIASLD